MWMSRPRRWRRCTPTCSRPRSRPARLHGVEIFELRLPAQANVALIVRGGKGFVPTHTTTLQAGDRLLIVATATVREETERRLRAVGRAGKLAGWFGEHGR